MTEKALFVKCLVEHLCSFFYYHARISEAWLLEKLSPCIAVSLRENIVDLEGGSRPRARRLIAMNACMELRRFEE